MADKPKTIRSKRSNLRFDGGKRAVTYKTEFEDGAAKLTNISAGGAAFINATLPLTVNNKVLITITSFGPETPFEVQGIVLRAEDSTFSVQFSLLQDSTKNDILKYFARMTRNDQQTE